MTTSGICEQFRLAPLQSRKCGSASITSALRMACALFLVCAATAIVSPAQSFRIVARGVGSNGPLVQGLDGNFYGTAEGGAYGDGTIFKMTRTGVVTTLYSFCAQTNCTDGSQPNGLVQGADGNFYGTTSSGGSCVRCAPPAGTFFKISPSGVLTTLYSFGFGTEGVSPAAGLIQGMDGNFYGTTTFEGGLCSTKPAGFSVCGAIFKITPSGTPTTLARFDTANASGALVQGTDGNLYGATQGTVFRVTPSGTFTTLHEFCNPQVACADGSQPNGLVQGADGNFYGTTTSGGIYGKGGPGTVFKITPGGKLTTLYNFCGQPWCTDGSYPGAGLVQATDGNFYGTTGGGGDTQCNPPYGCGTLFRINPTGTLTTLHSFNGTDGPSFSVLVQATSGTFYGTSPNSYDSGGTVFSLSVGSGWFTEELPSYGAVGATINILGTDLTGATHVSFTGNTARFTIISPTLIQAIVPQGATTGYVKVTLPSGRIPSNKKFRVTPQITSFTPTSGPVGTVATITGVSLSQAKDVSIGGKCTTFTVVDDGTLTATVPTGAATGRIRITTQGGTATSATNFDVD